MEKDKSGISMEFRQIGPGKFGSVGITVCQTNFVCANDEGPYTFPKEDDHRPKAIPSQFYFAPQEAKCMTYFIEGLTYSETGSAMGLSKRTVGFYCQRMRKRFHCKTKKELIALIKTNNCIEYILQMVEKNK